MRTLTLRQFPLTCHFALLAVAILVTHTGCDAVVSTAMREAKSLAYIGQVQLGEPTNEDGSVVVSLKYLGGKWGQDSAIVPIEVKSKVNDMEIDITVVTSVATNENAKEGHKLVLPADTKGKYKVYYLDPDGTRHEIGELEISD